MPAINFNNKTFALLENSENGKVTNQTIFKYQQEGNLVTADYFGGTIKYGKIIARLDGNQLNMLYQCLTTNDELKAGKAIADITFNENGKILLTLNWEWLIDGNGKGVSVYVEASDI